MNESIFDCTLEIASWLTNRGKRWARMKDYEKAVKDYTRSIDEFPDCQYPYLHRGDAVADVELLKVICDDVFGIESTSNLKIDQKTT